MDQKYIPAVVYVSSRSSSDQTFINEIWPEQFISSYLSQNASLYHDEEIAMHLCTLKTSYNEGCDSNMVIKIRYIVISYNQVALLNQVRVSNWWVKQSNRLSIMWSSWLFYLYTEDVKAEIVASLVKIFVR